MKSCIGYKERYTEDQSKISSQYNLTSKLRMLVWNLLVSKDNTDGLPENTPSEFTKLAVNLLEEVKDIIVELAKRAKESREEMDKKQQDGLTDYDIALSRACQIS